MRTILLAFTLFLSACSMVPDYLRPNLSLPESWRNDASAPSTALSSNSEWWKRFNSEEMNMLVDQAFVKNYDLDAAKARIDQARASRKTAASGLYPAIDASGSASRDWNDLAESGNTRSAYRTGLDMSYELDLWGKNRAAAKAGDARLAASLFDRDALALAVAGDTAATYISLLAQEDRLKVAASNLETSRELMRIIDARFKEGAASGLEEAQQKSEVAAAEASIGTLQQDRESLRNALAVLVSDLPQSFAVKGNSLDSMPVPEVAMVRPVDLLEKRPDIKSAEAALMAANIDIGEARASLFPSLDLGAGIALAASPASVGAKLASSLAALISVPIFQGGALEARVEGAEARKAELMANYKGAVLNALRDVENAASLATTSKERVEFLKSAADESTRAYDLARARYDAGSIDFQSLLTAQRDMLQRQDALVAARREQLLASIDLFRALGGN